MRCHLTLDSLPISYPDASSRCLPCTLRMRRYVKQRLLENIPFFVKKGEPEVILAVIEFLVHDNWLVRQAAVETIGHLMERDDEFQQLPHVASRPGTRGNSRAPSPRWRLAGDTLEPQRPEQGLVIEDHVGHHGHALQQHTTCCVSLESL
jgi:hypothetical protein